MSYRPTVASVDAKIDTLVKTQEAMHSDLKEHIASCNKIFHGNGKPGIITQVDRLEQQAVMKSRHFAYVWAALTALFSGLGVAFWTGK